MRRIAWYVIGVLRLIGIFGIIGRGFVIFESIGIGSIGQMPVFWKPEAIFFSIKACCYVGQKMPQKARFVIDTMPKLLAINWFKPLV